MAEEKSLQERLDDLKKGLETFTKTEIETSLNSIQEEVKKLNSKADKTEVEEFQKTLNSIKESIDGLNEKEAARVIREEKNQEAIDKFSVHLQRVPLREQKDEAKSFNQMIGDAIEGNADAIRGFRRGAKEVIIDLMPDVKKDKDGNRLVKAVGDMSITANFSDAVSLYQDVRQMIPLPYNRVFLSDVLPNGTSSGTQLIYPKENGGEGAAALWEDPTQDKPEIDYDLTTETVPFKWIAGVVIIDRAMLDDIPFLTSYIQNRMLISLRTAENAFILNGTANAPTVNGLLDVATSYNGSYTQPADKIVDAAYGQIVEDTFGFYNPTTVILRPRDAVKIGLQKATGSGEYNLPPGSAGFANGQLQLTGLQEVTTTSLDAGNFVVLDRQATMFVRRMVPELRLFEDATLARKNKLMFRIEERATLSIFNNNAIVKGTFTTGS